MPADDPRPTGADLAKGWLDNSAFVAKLGMRLEAMESGTARMRLPYDESLPTMGEIVARVLRRGAVTFLSVDVTGDDGSAVATALVTYRL